MICSSCFCRQQQSEYCVIATFEFNDIKQTIFSQRSSDNESIQSRGETESDAAAGGAATGQPRHEFVAVDTRLCAELRVAAADAIE